LWEQKDQKMNAHNIHTLFSILAAENPHPKTELHFHTPFELLIAVVLSAQSTDVGVNKATAKLFPVANTPQAILDLGLDKLKDYVKTIGLYNTKSANIMKACKILVDKHQGHVPKDRESLEELPGVGRKTANVILNTAFGEDTIAVDTHIFRVANRTGLAHGKTPLEVEKQLMKVIPKEFLHDAHHWLVLHGRYVCLARKPKCPTCPIREVCEYGEKTKP
jgi:endonuclease-3